MHSNIVLACINTLDSIIPYTVFDHFDNRLVRQGMHTTTPAQSVNYINSHNLTYIFNVLLCFLFALDAQALSV